MNKNEKKLIFGLIIAIIFIGYAYITANVKDTAKPTYNANNIPAFAGNDYVEINDNKPSFTSDELNTGDIEKYSDLDDLGRCGTAIALINKNTMPTEKRGSIGMIKPSGWHLVKYDIVNGKYLYNRCHLIGYQLAGENANPKNLITCTRHMNSETMLDFENKVASYVKKTNNSVLYRVTPIYEGDNLLATGVQMEAQSIGSDDISFNVFVYNVQPGIDINYKNGDSKLKE